jgi:competence ComEA-like helix-hairpin-helix protein
MAGERFMTTDHDTIRDWVETRNGKPSTVKSTHTEDDPGLIRLDFPGYSGGDSLEEISWDEWFEKFDESDLVLLYQETLADGGQSNFNKLISRKTAEENDSAEWAGESGGRSKSGKSGSRSSSGSSGSSSGGAGGGPKSKKSGGWRRGEKVNLNKASAEELDGVFGIGPATARKIIEYRDGELGGKFHSEHDITHIPGIGEKTAESIMKNARVK